MTVTCRVLKLSRQPYYGWLANPITPSEVVERIARTLCSTRTAMTRSIGHRLLADEARDAGSDPTAWRIASSHGWWSAFGKKRGRNGKKPGPPVPDDLCALTRNTWTSRLPPRLRLVFDLSRRWSCCGTGRSWRSRPVPCRWGLCSAGLSHTWRDP